MDASPRRNKSDKIACPRCGCLQSVVVARNMTTREQRTEGYWRRRSCEGCGAIFRTVELAQPDPQETETDHNILR